MPASLRSLVPTSSQRITAEPILQCPICRGRIALWAVQSAFTCHHCRWALSSNVHAVISKSIIVAVIAEVLFLAGLSLYFGSWSFALGVWLAAGCLLRLGRDGSLSAGLCVWCRCILLALSLEPAIEWVFFRWNAEPAARAPATAAQRRPPPRAAASVRPRCSSRRPRAGCPMRTSR